MKKEFILILEFKAEIGERLSIDAGDKEKTKHLNVLLKELLKHDRAIPDIYKLWLMADLTDGNQLFEMKPFTGKKTTEIELIRPLFDRLNDDTRAYFEKVLKMSHEKRISHFEPLFGQLGTLKVTKTNFIEKGN